MAHITSWFKRIDSAVIALGLWKTAVMSTVTWLMSCLGSLTAAVKSSHMILVTTVRLRKAVCHIHCHMATVTYLEQCVTATSSHDSEVTIRSLHVTYTPSHDCSHEQEVVCHIRIVASLWGRDRKAVCCAHDSVVTTLRVCVAYPPSNVSIVTILYSHDPDTVSRIHTVKCLLSHDPL